MTQDIADNRANIEQELADIQRSLQRFEEAGLSQREIASVLERDKYEQRVRNLRHRIQNQWQQTLVEKRQRTMQAKRGDTIGQERADFNEALALVSSARAQANLYALVARRDSTHGVPIPEQAPEDAIERAIDALKED